jgi:hypothetical protein
MKRSCSIARGKNMLTKAVLIMLVLAFQINASWRYLTASNSPLGHYNYNILSMQKDDASNIYLLDICDTVIKYSSGYWSKVSTKATTPDFDCQMLVGKDGTVYLGTGKSGMVKLKGDPFQNCPSAQCCMDTLGTYPLGIDANGRVIVFVGTLSMMNQSGPGVTAEKLLRISSDGECTPITIDAIKGCSQTLQAYRA